MDYNAIALDEFGMNFSQLNKSEQEWVKQEAQNNY